MQTFQVHALNIIFTNETSILRHPTPETDLRVDLFPVEYERITKKYSEQFYQISKLHIRQRRSGARLGSERRRFLQGLPILARFVNFVKL